MMVYILVILPGALIYLSLLWFTEMRGRQLFNAFLPSALVFLILYLLYKLWPVLGQLGFNDPKDVTDEHEHIGK